MRLQQKTILHVFSTFAAGGPQVRFTDVANHLGSRYRHVIVAMDSVTDAITRLSSGIDAELLAVPVRRGQTLVNLKTFRGVLKRLTPDLLVTSNWGSME